jgi:hypothetical protein
LCRKKTLYLIKYATPMHLDYTGKAYQQEPLHLKDRSGLLGIKHLKKHLVVMCCGTESRSHRLELVEIGRAKEP